jgi:hypothetical protein
MFATKVRDLLDVWTILNGKHHPFLSPLFDFLDFLRNFGMLLGLPCGLLSIIIATVYLRLRFRGMSWDYRVAFIVCDVLNVAGMWGIFSILNK